MSSEDPTPGLLTLQNLTINKPSLTDEDRRQAKYKLEQLKCYQEWYQQRPHRSALQNMIATLHYRLGEEDAATEALEEARKTDPNNINILHDLYFIYDKDYRKDDAEEVEAKLKVLLDKIKSDEGQLLYARCLAGKGLAWVFDLHPETKGTTRLDNSIRFYEMALNIAGNVVSSKEKEDWKYYLALGCVLQIPINKANEKNTVEFYTGQLENAMECLKPNLQSEDLHRRSDAWCLLGNLISLRPHSLKAIPDVIKKNEYRIYWGCHGPEKCYRQSFEFNSENYITLNQLARFFYDQNNLDKALEVLDQSLELRSGITNMSALHLRAQVLRIKFNKQQKNHERSGKGPSPDYSLLERAKDDLLLCTEYNPYVLDMIHLAEVLHKLSWNQELGVIEKRKLGKALQWCTKAEKCQDGAQRPELHQRRALILQDMGDHETAVKCFMQAIDCENPGTTYNGNFLYMINGMLSRYHNSPEKPLHRLKELAYWLDGGLDKYTKARIKVSKFVKSYPEELLSIAEVLSHSSTKRRLEVSKKLLDAFRDTNTLSSEKEKLDKIAIDVSEGFKSLTKSKPKSPTSPGMPQFFCKEREANIKLDTVSEKDSSQFQFSAVDKHSSLPVEASDEVASRRPAEETGQSKTVDPASLSSTVSSGDLSESAKVMDISGRYTSGGASGDLLCEPLSDLQSSYSLMSSTSSAQEQSRSVTGQDVGRHCDLEQPRQSCAGHPITTPCEDQAGKLSSVDSGNNISDGNVSSIPHSESSSSVKLCLTLQTSSSTDSGLHELELTEVNHLNITDFVHKVLEKSDLIAEPDDIADSPPTAKHPGFNYDFYAVYNTNCTRTCQWVYYHLCSQLENPYKGCIPERDFTIGRQISRNIEDAINQSAKILLIISNGCFNDPWCKKAIMLAMQPENEHKVVPILLDKVTLPMDLKALYPVDASTTIIWKRIRESLEKL